MKIFGKNPDGMHHAGLSSSVNYKNGEFINQSPTVMLAEDASYLKLMGEFFKRKQDRVPKNALPSLKSDVNLKRPGIGIHWFGHSSYLISIDGFKVLVDPVFSGYASPFSFGVRAFPGSDIYKPVDFESIDLLILTHDHYDHLDYNTLLQLKGKVKQIVCSLGVSSHLLYWGFNEQIITELDWWQDKKINNHLNLTATPARHFSGRTFKRAQTLWSSFVLQTSYGSIFIGGDSGYDSHFKEINKAFGDFVLAFLECGQYNEKWPMIHMAPEQTAEAALDLNAEIVVPVHWGKFALAYHPWNEPVERVILRSSELKINVATPLIGEEFFLNNPNTTYWWRV